MPSYIAVFSNEPSEQKILQFKTNCTAKSFKLLKYSSKKHGRLVFTLHEMLFFRDPEIIDDDAFLYEIKDPKNLNGLALMKMQGSFSPKYILHWDAQLESDVLRVYYAISGFQAFLNHLFDFDSSVAAYDKYVLQTWNRAKLINAFDTQRLHDDLQPEQEFLKNEVDAVLKGRLI